MKFHYEILSPEQKKLLSIIGKIKNKFTLCGGTAIALYLGHRKSIDYDFFLFGKDYLDLNYILSFEKNLKGKNLILDLEHQRNIIFNNVKITYVAYPFNIDDIFLEEYFSIPSLISLAAMKAYTIGRRAKWKDYVDLYFLINKFGVDKIVKKAKNIFGGDFSEKMFIRQLGYFDYIDSSEEVEFMNGFEKTKDKIKDFLFGISKKHIF